MSDRADIYIPVRSLSDGLQRLAPALDTASRSRLATELARHTLTAAVAVAPTYVITNDAAAGELAESLGVRSVPDPGGGLNAAASVATARSDTWAVVHSDLPLLTATDLVLLTDRSGHGTVMAPSYDGGTTGLCGRGPFPFSYGPGSAGRHLRHASSTVVRTGFLLDIDRPDDLAAARSHPLGAWLNDVLPSDVT